MAVIGCAGAPACAKETAVIMGPGSRGACHRARIRATRWLARDDVDRFNFQTATNAILIFVITGLDPVIHHLEETRYED